MDFEFDPIKSKSNLRKHGIDFNEAQHLWEDPMLLVVSARIEDEARWIAIGKINHNLWAAVFTTRDKRIRLISVRRARKVEMTYYEGA